MFYVDLRFKNGSYFKGWSNHVEVENAVVTVRFLSGKEVIANLQSVAYIEKLPKGHADISEQAAKALEQP